MRQFLFVLILFGCTTTGISQTHTPPPAFAQKVYDDIYNAMSDGKVDKPYLVISDSPTEVATYLSKGVDRKIILGINFIDLTRNFGKDSCNALAHVLGHELAHVILRQKDLMTTGSGYASVEFNKKVKDIKEIFQDSLFERQADEFATLYAHIAGYQTSGLGAILLDSIYQRFHLTDAKLSNYPKLIERKEIVQFSERKMNTLRQFYDASILCAISKNYEMSEALNKAIILENFPSREIHNNIGVSLLMRGIDLLDTLEFPYQFPIAIDVNTRLNGSTTRSITNEAETFLKEARDRFTKSTACSQNYYIAWLNLAVVNFILGDEDEYAIALLKLKNCSDANILNKLDVLKVIKEKHDNKKGHDDLYSNLCDVGNSYACDKIQSQKNVKIQISLPSTFSFLNDFQKPTFDFSNDAARVSDTLNKILSVTKNNFSYRKLMVNGILGERWKYKNEIVQIYTIKTQVISESEIELLHNYAEKIGIYCNDIYLKYNEIYIVLRNNEAKFYYIN